MWRHTLALEQVRQETADPVRLEKIREHFRQIIEGRQLPALPVVVTKVLGMLSNPDLNMRVLCPVLSGDVALAARIIAISRSPYYGQRTLPTTLQAAVQVMGLRDLRNVIISVVTYGLFKSGGQVAETLWAHSLGVALASRILTFRSGRLDPEQAFLAGLLHDVGQMVFLQGDGEGYSRMARAACLNGTPIADAEQELYGFDHDSIGAKMLESWNIEEEIGKAVGAHHNHEQMTDAKSLPAVLIMADYLAFKAGLGFFTPAPFPAREILRSFAFENDEVLAQAVEEVRCAFGVESVLIKAT
jgi:putative nucleotidyltransferase with HDIG domain